MRSPASSPRSELLLVGNASVGEAHNFVDRHLSLQSVQDVLPPPVLNEVDALRTFSDQCSPPRKRDESTDSPDEICSCVEAFMDHEALITGVAVSAADTYCSAKDASSRQKETPAAGRGLGSSD